MVLLYNKTIIEFVFLKGSKAMAIIITDNKIILETKNTAYAFEIMHGKFPVHHYYGKKKVITDAKFPYPIYEFAPFYREYGQDYSPSMLPSEFPFFGSGDFRSSSLKLRNLTTGSDVTLFTYKSANIIKGRVEIPSLPISDADGKTETLELVLFDEANQCELKLYYTLFEDCDVITRYFVLNNLGTDDVRIEKCMMMALDIPTTDLDVISFHGSWAQERHYQRNHVVMGNQSMFSRRGSSSHNYNPFFMLCDSDATEESGSAYAFNLVYSGSFLNEIETDHYGYTRVLSGLGSECFNYLLRSGEVFHSPEAVMTFADCGIGAASRNMHKFVREYILRKCVFEKRPVVLNAWEAVEFNIDLNLMQDLAKETSKLGTDMLVMDDGWFGKCRNSQYDSMGDWYPNPNKFPDGLLPLVKGVKESGINFGIWMEPEMAGYDSDVFRAHPEWILKDPRREQLIGREQYVLDMANPEVIDYLKDCIANIFDNHPIDYLKWDMNRNMTEVYSPSLPPERQGEAQYRYMLGVYELYSWLNKTYPHVMIENCSGGGGRFDLGMMKYSVQIWTSDNTKPIDRTYIQNGTTYGYPTATMSCHVANHNGSVEDERLMDYAFKVAINGPLGYEFNAVEISDKARATIKNQIEFYRSVEHLIINGDFYRLQNPEECGKYSYYFVNEDNSEILLTYLQNYDESEDTENILKVSRAEKDAIYTDKISGLKFKGTELNNGIVIKSNNTGYYSKIYYFEKEE